MTDFYKILNVTFETSETEIKKQFRKLATTYHPDKNGGSEKSEETFKIILNAYETLSNKQRRAIYDLKYKQHFHKPKPEYTDNTNSNTKEEQFKQAPSINKESQNTKTNYNLWIVLIIFIFICLYSLKKATTEDLKLDKQIEEKSENRPQSGELDFNE